MMLNVSLRGIMIRIRYGWKGEMHLILFPFISFVDLRKVETMYPLQSVNCTL